MTPEQWNEALSNLDIDLIEEQLTQWELLHKGNRRNRIWLSLGAAAACLAILAGTILLNPIQAGPHSEPTSMNVPQQTQIPTDIVETQPPLKMDNFSDLTGSSLEFVTGSSTEIPSGGQAEACPPAFEFQYMNYVVVARVKNHLPDTYYKLDVSSTYKPTAYRLVEMELVQAIHGTDMPTEFLYLLPEYLYVDMSVYDSLLIAMTQLGTEGYVLRNSTLNRMEACNVPVFCDEGHQPELGNIIAFTDGIFDESLWQHKSWKYGYQFGGYYLDNPQYGDLVVSRGGSLEETLTEINSRLDAYQQRLGDGYQPPTPVTLDFETQAAKDALDFVKPFENGVFSQLLETRTLGGRLTFRRYINGCQTEETVSINLTTEEVTYSDVRYTSEDMENLQNIALYLSEQAAAYAKEIPTPPHIDPEGKDLLCLSLYAWYAKVDGKLYGVVKTAWRYKEDIDWGIQYYDDEYVLFDITAGTAAHVSRDDLLDLLGQRNIYTGAYGEEIEIPLC